MVRIYLQHQHYMQHYIICTRKSSTSRFYRSSNCRSFIAINIKRGKENKMILNHNVFTVYTLFVVFIRTAYLHASMKLGQVILPYELILTDF